MYDSSVIVAIFLFILLIIGVALTVAYIAKSDKKKPYTEPEEKKTPVLPKTETKAETETKSDSGSHKLISTFSGDRKTGRSREYVRGFKAEDIYIYDDKRSYWNCPYCMGENDAAGSLCRICGKSR